MSTQTKGILALVAVLLIGAAMYGAFLSSQGAISFGSSAGTTFNTAKFAGIVMVPSVPGTNATTSSILNSDAGTRYVTNSKLACTGVGSSFTQVVGTGLANWQLTIGTTSTAAPATFTQSGIYAPVMPAFSIATNSASTEVLVSSTTLATATSSKAVPWHSGEYMTFGFNATNTAACTVGVDYIGS